MNDQWNVKCEIESDFVDERSGISRNDKPYEIRSQKVWVFLNSKHPKEGTLNLDKGQPAFAPGLYHFDVRPTLDIGDFGKFIIDSRRVQLRPLPASAPTNTKTA